MADAVAPGSEKTTESGIDGWALGFHRRPVECAYVVQVNIDGEPVESEVKYIERRSTLEGEAFREDRIAHISHGPIPCPGDG